MSIHYRWIVFIAKDCKIRVSARIINDDVPLSADAKAFDLCEEQKKVPSLSFAMMIITNARRAPSHGPYEESALLLPSEKERPKTPSFGLEKGRWTSLSWL